MANIDAKGTPVPPPNLRVSDDEERECDSCLHYDRGRCKMFPTVGHVDGEWVCDKWERGGPSSRDNDDQDEDDRPFRGRNLREAEQEAFTRVRAHRRRIRSKSDENSGEPDPSDRLK